MVDQVLGFKNKVLWDLFPIKMLISLQMLGYEIRAFKETTANLCICKPSMWAFKLLNDHVLCVILRNLKLIRSLKVHLESIVMLLESVLAPKIMSYDLYFAFKLMHCLFLVES